MDDKNIYPENEIFNRSHLLLGDETMEKLKNTEVIIFGIGGVGSWTAESLIRTGVRNLTIVDADTVAVSNINRQAPATTLTVGESKVEAMRHRLLQINPDANITAIRQIYRRPYRFRIRPRTIRLYNRCNRLPGRQSNTYHQCNECLTPQTIVINGGGIEDGSDQDTSCRILESKRLQTCSSIAYPLQT